MTTFRKPARRTFLQLSAATLALASLPTFAQSVTAGTKLKIGIIGSGNVGSALGTTWAKSGHTVMFSSLDLEKDKALAAKVGSGARAGTSKEAAAFGDVLLIAVPYHALPAVGKDLGDLLKGKVVIDACNPFEQRDGELGVKAREVGAGLMSAKLLPGARIVRGFNAIGAARMGAAWQEPGKVGMPIAGDDAQAIATASNLVRDIGFEPVLIGGLAMGRHLQPREPLAGERSADEIRKIAAGLK
jgi:8-hydroxy-5-deazaflavin:NADPH oxidoreductase